MKTVVLDLCYTPSVIAVSEVRVENEDALRLSRRGRRWGICLSPPGVDTLSGPLTQLWELHLLSEISKCNFRPGVEILERKKEEPS